MLSTITALILSAAGAGLGTAGCVMAARSGAKQRDFSVSVANQLVKHTTAMAAAQGLKSDQAFMELSARLEGLEFTAAEQLITRAEVSSAFAELAAIEEQRQRQAAAVRASVAVMPPVTPAPMVAANAAQAPAAGAQSADPWGSATAVDVAPANPATLISEITAMNERLREKLRTAGVFN